MGVKMQENTKKKSDFLKSILSEKNGTIEKEKTRTGDQGLGGES